MPDHTPQANQDSHALIFERLDAIHEDIKEIKIGVKEQNGRVRKHDALLAVLKWAVFGGGSLLLGIVAYLIKGHLRL